MFGNNDRFVPRLVRERAEGLLEFAGSHAGCLHGWPRFYPLYTKSGFFQARYPKARYPKVWWENEESFGPGHPNVAIDLNNLAQLLQDTNRLAEAEPLKRRALAIDEKSFGPEHPNVARDLNNLAMLLQATNRLSETEPLMRRALAIWEASLPDHHPSVQLGRDNLKALLSEIEAAEAHAAEGPLTRPQSGHPLPRGERVTAPAAPFTSAAPAEDSTAKRGLLARLFGRG